jgi:hypothetical protein
MVSYEEDVDFNTIDGLTLRGRVYHAESIGPGIVLCPGVSKTASSIPNQSTDFRSLTASKRCWVFLKLQELFKMLA